MSNFDEIFIKEMSSIDAYNYGRQEAEKELNEIHLCECNQIRAEAYNQGAREFAELLKKKFNEFIDYDDDGEQTFESNPDLVWIAIDEVLAEMQKEVEE